MKLYRALSRLRLKKRNIPRWHVFSDTELSAKSINILLKIQRIAPVTIPPIEALWPARAEQLAAAGITTFEKLFMADPEQCDGLASHTVARWQREAVRLFEP